MSWWVAIFASSRTSEEEKHVSRITFYKLFVTHLLFVGGTGNIISNPNIVDGYLYLGGRMDMSDWMMGWIMRGARGQKEMSWWVVPPS
jgi:hypothetical protein